MLIITFFMSLFRCPHIHKIITSQGDVIFKECGKCRYCRSKRAALLTANLINVSRLYKYVHFFTLTYNNENLPTARFIDSSLPTPFDTCYLDAGRFGIDVSELDSTFFAFDSSLVYSGLNIVPPVPTNYSGSCFGVLCKRDVQLFNKRLRRFIDYDKDGLFKDLPISQRRYKYYICGEYGPNTLRPHYHGLFFTNDRQVSAALEHYYIKAWSLCDDDPKRYDFDHVKSSAAGYVSSYVNSFVNLPRLLQTKYTRPFHIKSQHLGFFENEEKKVFEEISNGVVERVRTEIDSNGTLKHVRTKLPFSIVNRLFPKCVGFKDNFKDIGALLAMYSPISSNHKLALSEFKSLGSNYFDPYHYNNDGSYGSYNWRNISCVRSCMYVCRKFDISVFDYILILVSYYSRLDMLSLHQQYIDMEEFNSSLPASKIPFYQHVFCADSFSWLREKLPFYFSLFPSDGELSIDIFSNDPFSVSSFVEFYYYGISPSDLLDFYDFNSIYDRFELNLERLRSCFDFRLTDYYLQKKSFFDDRYERQLMSKKINNSRYACLLQREPLL